MLANARMFTQEQVHALNTQGYAVLPAAVPLSTVAHLLEAFSTLTPSHAYRNILDLPAVRQFATASTTLDFISHSLGNTAFPVRAILFDKLPDANWKVPWHQDLSIAVKERREATGYGPWSIKDGIHHVQPPAQVLENMLTLRLHLDDCLKYNGPLRVLPGTHTREILSPQQIQHLREQIPEAIATLRAGGILLMRPLLLHASSPATNPSHRRVLHIEYAAVPLPSPLQWHAA